MKVLLRNLGLGLAVVFALGGRAQAQVLTVDTCAGDGLSLAKRSGTPGCWVELVPRAEASKDAIFCVPREAWKSWLSSQDPGALCGTWQGRWKIFSPFENDPPGQVRTLPLKRTIRIFRVSAMPGGAPSRLDRIRKKIETAREILDEWLVPLDATGILRELLTGTRSPGGASEMLSLLGFVHLLWLSGLHLYAVARLWDWAMKRLACRFSELPLPWVRAAAGISTALTWLTVWLLSGARPAMFRPWALLGLRRSARILGFKWRELAPFFVALGLDAALGIWRGGLGELGNPSRCVYALSCGGALLARSPLGVAVGSWVMAAVFQAWRSGTVALATPFLSLFCVPLFAGILYPLVLLASACKAAGLTSLADALAGFCGRAAAICVAGLASLTLKEPTLWCVGPLSLLLGIALAAGALFAKPKQRAAALSLICVARAAQIFLPLAHAASAAPPPAALRVEQLDVGQGDAALVTSLSKPGDEPGFGLIDSGSERALGDRAWIELLARRGVRRLDWVALTHLDEDHSGGIRRLGKLLPIGCVATSIGEIESQRGQVFKRALEGLGIRLTDWSGPCVPFPTLAPSEPGAASQRNQNMGAVLIPLGPRGSLGFYLSAGDAEARDEPRIGAWARLEAANLASGPRGVRILKISHHGSKTSSNPGFIQEIDPTEAWISVGAGNRYGHPSASVLEELAKMKVPYARTDERGALCAGRCGIDLIRD